MDASSRIAINAVELRRIDVIRRSSVRRMGTQTIVSRGRTRQRVWTFGGGADQITSVCPHFLRNYRGVVAIGKEGRFARPGQSCAVRPSRTYAKRFFRRTRDACRQGAIHMSTRDAFVTNTTAKFVHASCSQKCTCKHDYGVNCTGSSCQSIMVCRGVGFGSSRIQQSLRQGDS